jgi:hypothetical protein
VAPQEVGAEALLIRANLRIPTDDKRVESTALLCHVNVQLLHFHTALHMSVRVAMALLVHAFATVCGFGVLRHASTKAILCEAIHVLLVFLVLVLESLLDVQDKHGADGLQSVLDVLVKLPARFRDGFLSQTLDKGLHLRGISVTNSCQKIVSR